MQDVLDEGKDLGNFLWEMIKHTKDILMYKVSKKNDKYIPIYRDIENTFQGFFGTKVKLDAGERKGKIIIQYSSNDDLERILGLIK